MELSKEEMELFLHSPVIRSKKLSLRNFPYLVYCFQTVFQKQEMDLSKEEMELFLPFPVIRSKNFLYKSFPIWSTASKLVIRNRKLNYLSRKWNYFPIFGLSDQKTSFTKVTPFGSLIPKWFAETGNGIISPLSGHLIKKLMLQKFPHLVR